MPRLSKLRLAFHVFLFLLTLYTTSLVGAGFAQAFNRNFPADIEFSFKVFLDVRHQAGLLSSGLPYALTLLAILLAHEMGHYLTCVRYRIDATPPYFIPAPTLIGTFGAFIWIRSPIYSKKQLFDVGVAGPLAGFAVLVPALLVGLGLSKTVPGIANHGDLVFGTPLAIRFGEWLFFPGVPISDIYLHPIARAAWAGLLATALNLLPIGQLDGGHILYAFFGKHHRWMTRIFLLALAGIAPFTSWSWLLWAVALFLLARNHPVIVDDAKLGPGRTVLGWLALAIFVISFTAVPVRFMN